MSWGSILYFLLWAGAFAVMMRFGCGAHVMGHGRRRDGWKTPDQTVDPVCGMSVRTAAARSTLHAGQVYFFCSQACREKFEAAPATYLKTGVGVAPPAQQQENRHGSCC